MPQRIVAKRPILSVRQGTPRASSDELAGEEPMEIRLDGHAVAVTMRTPGDDFDLALGFALTEGLVEAAGDVETMRYCVDVPDEQHYNVVDIRRHETGPLDEGLQRSLYISSSCGVCGTASIDGVRRVAADVTDDPLHIQASVVAELPDRLRAAQTIFDRTGGLHAAGLFDAAGELLSLREDVGRHNAVDKVIGWAAREQRLPLRETLLVVSGRVAFEIVQKALLAGIPAVVAISAPTSLAVSLAQESGMTLVGFVRDGNFNVYTHEQRIALP